MAKISTILDEIDNGSIALPVFQRGYVWSRKQVSELFASLYRGHPIGSLLIWKTSSAEAEIRGDLPAPSTPLQLLLDGQQRMTSLYGVMRGKEPAFFDGNANAFSGLRFNLEEESFEFYQPVKMRDDPLWIDVSELYQNGTQGVQTILSNLSNGGQNSTKFMGRLLDLLAVSDKELHIELVTGEDKTVETVVDIFNQVNSGGTKLTSGDLALANICANWPEARDIIKLMITTWREQGFKFTHEWLLHVVNAIVKGEAKFSHLHDLDSKTIEEGLHKAETYANKTLNIISGRLGLDHDRVLFAKPAISTIASFYNLYGLNLTHVQRDKLLFWYAHAGMWGRYSGASDATLGQDLTIIQKSNSIDEYIDSLIEEMEHSRGSIRVTEQDFLGSKVSTRFYAVLYMLTRMGKALDLVEGIPLTMHHLGKMAQLEKHHIFPKALLKKFKFDNNDINAIANYCFLTKESNLKIKDRNPAEYLEECELAHPGVLESQWIPTEPELWKITNYFDFLETRRQFLASATNDLLDGLRVSSSEVNGIDYESNAVYQRSVSIATDEEETLLFEINEWVTSQGIQAGIMGYELVDPSDESVICVFDLAWPEGLQAELSEPIALLIDEDIEVLEAAGKNGYRFYTKTEDFKEYVNRILN